MPTGIIIQAKKFFKALDSIDSRVRIIASRLNRTAYTSCKPDLKAILDALDGLRAQYRGHVDFKKVDQPNVERLHEVRITRQGSPEGHEVDRSPNRPADNH